MANMGHMNVTPPPSSNSNELLQDGFRYLLQHNSTTSYPQDLQSENMSRYQQPPPAPAYKDYLLTGRQLNYPQPQAGLGISYEGFASDHRTPGLYDRQYSQYHEQYGTPVNTPPRALTPGSDYVQTRSGRKVHHSLRPLPSKVNRSSRVKKPRKEKGKAEKKITKLDKPLSEITKGWDHVAIVDIEAYVNRSAEERRREVNEGKSPGKIKRPMNSFMLYRKAYQNRTKDWGLQDNHQVVSQVCGESWRLEPDDIRRQYNEWAKIERANHQAAHPGYKFTPSKAGTKGGKQKKSEEPASDSSDLEDFDWEKANITRIRKFGPRAVSDSSYQQSRDPYNYSRDSSIEPVNGAYNMNMSSYQASNPGRQVPLPYAQTQLEHGQYLQQVVHSSQAIEGAEDVLIRKIEAPGMYYPNHPSFQEYDLASQYQAPLLTLESQTPLEDRIDPSLMSQVQDLYNTPYAAEPLYLDNRAADEWQTPFALEERTVNDDPLGLLNPPRDFGLAAVQMTGQGLDLLKGGQDSWQVESLDNGHEFDKWMDEA